MAKMPTQGHSTFTLPFAEQNLDVVLDCLRAQHGIDINLTDDHRKVILWEIKCINGAYLQEKERLDIKHVVGKLKSVEAGLESVVAVLSALEEGLQDGVDLEAVFQIAEGHAKKHGFSIPANSHDDMRSFRETALEFLDVVQARIVALEDIHGQRGRPGLNWYDKFTALLLQLAGAGGIKPTISTDRTTGKKGGDFLILALAMEQLLIDETIKREWNMRSSTPGACAKRLERSLKRLKKSNDKNGSAKAPILST